MKLSVSSAMTQTESKSRYIPDDVEDLLKQSIEQCRTLTGYLAHILAHGSLVDVRDGSSLDARKVRPERRFAIKENTDTRRMSSSLF